MDKVKDLNLRGILFLIISSILVIHLVEAKIVNRICVWVNDEIITQTDIDKAMSMLGSDITPEQMNKLRHEVLEKLIEEKILLQEAKRQEIKISPREVDEALNEVKRQFKSLEDFKKALKEEGLSEDSLRQEYEENLIKKELIDREINVMVSPEELKQIREEFAYQIKVRHILVKTKPEAILILARLDKGEKFEDLAKKYSLDTGTKDKGGMIDFFTKGKMVKEFSEAAFALRKPGEISGIVETKFGFHIIQLVEKKELTDEELEEIVKAQQEKLRQAKFKEEFSRWISKLKEKTSIRIQLEE